MSSQALADYNKAAATISFCPSSPLGLPLLVNRGLLCIDIGQTAQALHDFLTAQKV